MIQLAGYKIDPMFSPLPYLHASVQPILLCPEPAADVPETFALPANRWTLPVAIFTELNLQWLLSRVMASKKFENHRVFGVVPIS
jgi:hypothetical protein